MLENIVARAERRKPQRIIIHQVFFKRENKRNDDYLLYIPGKPVGSK